MVHTSENACKLGPRLAGSQSLHNAIMQTAMAKRKFFASTGINAI
jgi:hypothetical protein